MVKIRQYSRYCQKLTINVRYVYFTIMYVPRKLAHSLRLLM